MSPAPQPESKAATLMRRLASSVVLLGVVFYGLLAPKLQGHLHANC